MDTHPDDFQRVSKCSVYCIDQKHTFELIYTHTHFLSSFTSRPFIITHGHWSEQVTRHWHRDHSRFPGSPWSQRNCWPVLFLPSRITTGENQRAIHRKIFVLFWKLVPYSSFAKNEKVSLTDTIQIIHYENKYKFISTHVNRLCFLCWATYGLNFFRNSPPVNLQNYICRSSFK